MWNNSFRHQKIAQGCGLWEKENIQSKFHIYPSFLLGIPSKPREREVEPNGKQQSFYERNRLEYRTAKQLEFTWKGNKSNCEPGSSIHLWKGFLESSAKY